MDGTAAKPIRSLSSSTFVGLLLAQFTATFNDQALHIVAIFFASDIFVRYLDLRGVDEKGVVAAVTACFITPFLLFSPLAGELADRFSKRSIIVLWKVVEVLIMALALVALALPHWIVSGSPSAPGLAATAAGLAAATVFLMGVHSTFFVPAKYGIMPELLDPSILSRGNGLLEGTSFMAQIFGTAAGGLLYAVFKSEIRPGTIVPGHEWFIGLLLLLFSVIGTATALFMDKVPPANPGKRIDWGWWRPLSANLKLVRQSKPLTLALTGIAFAAFLTLFVRQTLLYDAEQAKEASVVARMLGEETTAGAEMDHTADGAPRSLAERARAALNEPELQVSLLIALVGFGVGLGSVCAGYLSGDRVELGLVPVGGTVLVLLFVVVALFMRSAAALTGLLFLVGIAAGLYIVPLYT
jgi:acyl-[acyl-carrier-protein]-phospholipid O-acyltransferase/long-chain-fatty-acid--[acyl-carrier-protein] ligase